MVNQINMTQKNVLHTTQGTTFQSNKKYSSHNNVNDLASKYYGSQT